MNLILDKKSFIEWQNKIRNIIEELNEKYYIVTESGFTTNFTRDYLYLGKFIHICSKNQLFCGKCNRKHYINFNYRYKIWKYNKYIKSIYKCDKCLKIKLSKNY